MEKITTLFWDLGGVALTNGWDRNERINVLNGCGITSKEDLDEFGDRHREVNAMFEIGKCTLDEYLKMTLFGLGKNVTHEKFKQLMFVQSRTLPGYEVLKAVAASGNYFLAALNNESRELNDYRIKTFELPKYFKVFCSSCYLGLMKPNPEIYLAALNIAQKRPAECIFIDDRAQNAEAARQCGMHAIHYHDPDQLKEEFNKLGVKF